MTDTHQRIRKIEDPRLVGYTKRLRSGSTQTFYTGSDHRDFDRYHAEKGPENPDVKIHDKPDTIRLIPPEKHWFAALIDGEWWWLNSCEECNGRARDGVKSYVECDKHDVCRQCKTPRTEIKDWVWGSSSGWQCQPCQEAEKAARRREALNKFDEKNFNAWTYHWMDSVKCPYCDTKADFDYDGDNEPEPITCEACDHTFKLVIEFQPQYTTSRIAPKSEA